jgi:hypothetical protein
MPTLPITQAEEELRHEERLDNAVSKLLGASAFRVKLVSSSWLAPGSYLYDERNPVVIYASPDVLQRLREILPDGSGTSSETDRASKQ